MVVWMDEMRCGDRDWEVRREIFDGLERKW